MMNDMSNDAETKSKLALPNALDELLPVGMLTNGGLIAEAIARVAQKQVGMPDWAAFHYVKNSDGTLEITGGIVSTHAGAKKWLGEHDTIQIRADEVLAQLHDLAQHHAAFNAMPEAQVAALKTDESTQTLSARPSKRMQVVFSLPNDAATQLAILKRFHLSADICGAQVLACQLVEDQINESA